jgi:hypothetical protein
MLRAHVQTTDSPAEGSQQVQTSSLAFLHERAAQPTYPLSPEEQRLLGQAHSALMQAEQVIVCLGGRAGRLGECLVGTGVLEGVLLALRQAGKAGTPVSLVVDQPAAELFDERIYQAHCWPQFRVLAAPFGQAPALIDQLLQRNAGKQCLVVDAHGAQDGMPFLRFEERPLLSLSGSSEDAAQVIITLGRWFRVGVRSYAQRGAERRYADGLEDVFALPAGALDGLAAQPRIWLSAADAARFPTLARACGLRRSALLVVCFFQSLVLAKCYSHWREVLRLLCAQMARHFPGQAIDFLLACGPDDDLPAGVKLADVSAAFAGFAGAKENARVLVRATPSLRDLAVVVQRAALVLSNDSGPGHLAGALQVPTIVPYLPGQVYSKTVWASTPWHHGVTLEPSPFPRQQIEDAVLWDRTDIIDSIPPERLAREALAALKTRVPSGGYRTPRANAIPGGRQRATSVARCPPRHLEG